MDNHKQFGIYLVNTGENFGLKNCMTSQCYYVVHGITRVTLGMFHQEVYAINLAIGLERRDQLILSNEIEKILINSPETNKK